MEGRAITGVIFAGAVALTLGVTRAGVMQNGQYALPQGKPQIVSRISLSKNGELAVTQYAPGSREPIAPCGSNEPRARPCYELVEGEPLHVILIRDDFGAFSHVHPQLVPKHCLRCAIGSSIAGTFAIRVDLEPRHRYYAYVSSKVSGMPEQVFRFVLQSAAAPTHGTVVAIKPSANARAGPYQVSLDQPKLRAGNPQILNADIAHDPHAPGVAPYHVAWVRAILINTASLTYGHVDGAIDHGICCEYALPVPALSKGLYKLWLQFSDGSAIYTAPFTFAAQ
jgi:hypothetical protein